MVHSGLQFKIKYLWSVGIYNFRVFISVKADLLFGYHTVKSFFEELKKIMDLWYNVKWKYDIKLHITEVHIYSDAHSNHPYAHIHHIHKCTYELRRKTGWQIKLLKFNSCYHWRFELRGVLCSLLILIFHHFYNDCHCFHEETVSCVRTCLAPSLTTLWNRGRMMTFCSSIIKIPWRNSEINTDDVLLSL